MFEGFLSVGGNEVGHNQRVLTYASRGIRPRTMSVAMLCGCNTLGPSFGETYTDPATDDAPWYDPSAAESADFAGLFIESITGTDSTLNASFTPRVGIGSSRGPLLRSGRSLVVTGWLIAKTCSALTYGLQWLTGALGGLCDPCGADVCFLSTCPAPEDPDWKPLARTLHGAGLLSGPTVTDRLGSCCESCGATAYQVTFTIGVENPWVYRRPVVVDAALPWDTTDVQTIAWAPTCEACAPAPCAAPACLVPPPAFGRPDLCYCFPWVSTVRSLQITPPRWWSDAVLQITVRSGGDELRNLSFTAWTNPAGLAGPEVNPETWRCKDPCSEVLVPFLPAHSTLVIDGARRQALITCGSADEADGSAYVESFGNRWFEIGCAPTLLAARVDALHVSPQASFDVELVARDQVL